MPHRKDPADMTLADIATLIMAYREIWQRERHRAALAANLIDKIKDIMDACTIARVAAELAASDVLNG